MCFVNNTLSRTKWYLDSSTLEDKTFLNRQILSEVRGGQRGGYSRQILWPAVLDDGG